MLCLLPPNPCASSTAGAFPPPGGAKKVVSSSTRSSPAGPSTTVILWSWPRTSGADGHTSHVVTPMRASAAVKAATRFMRRAYFPHLRDP